MRDRHFSTTTTWTPLRKTLLARSRPPRTFASMLAFVSVLLLATGGYLIDDALRNPLHAAEAAVLFAGFALVLGALLLYALIPPLRGSWRRSSRPFQPSEFPFTPSVVVERRVLLLPRENHARGIAGK